MFGLFENMTPQYTGYGQPTAISTGGGAFGFLTGLLATATPNYQVARAELSANTPTTTVVPLAEPTPCQSAPVEQVAQSECHVPLPIAIVIHRPE
jgi:hypothetical protein